MGTNTLDARSIVDGIATGRKATFEARRTILSFDEYLDEVVAWPTRHLRNSARYLMDVVPLDTSLVKGSHGQQVSAFLEIEGDDGVAVQFICVEELQDGIDHIGSYGSSWPQQRA